MIKEKNKETKSLKEDIKDLNQIFHAKLLSLFNEESLTVKNLIDKIYDKLKIELNDSTIYKFMQDPQKHYLNINIICAICKALDLNIAYFFNGSQYEDLFETYDEFFVNDSLTNKCEHIRFLEKQYYVYFGSTNSKEKNIIVSGMLFFEECNSKIYAKLIIDIPKNSPKEYSGKVYFSLINKSVYIIFSNVNFGEISFISFKPIILNSNKMNYVIAECLTTCSGTEKDPTVHRMIISVSDILNSYEDIIRMELQLNSSKVYLDENKWKFLKESLNINDDILKNDLLESDNKNILIIKEKHLLNLIKQYNKKNNLNINENDIIIETRSNQNIETYNKVGEKVNKDFYKYLYDKMN